MEALDSAEDEFDRLVETGDDASVLEHVDIVEAARAELNKTRTLHAASHAAQSHGRPVGEVHGARRTTAIATGDRSAEHRLPADTTS